MHTLHRVVQIGSQLVENVHFHGKHRLLVLLMCVFTTVFVRVCVVGVHTCGGQAHIGEVCLHGRLQQTLTIRKLVIQHATARNHLLNQMSARKQIVSVVPLHADTHTDVLCVHRHTATATATATATTNTKTGATGVGHTCRCVSAGAAGRVCVGGAAADE
jgi:hypothetical protein